MFVCGDLPPLIKVVHQSDTRFYSVLTKIGCVEHLIIEETGMIQSTFRNYEFCSEICRACCVRTSKTRMKSYKAKSIPETDTTVDTVTMDLYTGYSADMEW